jgi:hypothetical protein
LFGSLNFGQGKPTPQIIANTFKDGASNAMLMSAILAAASFLLVFALPKRIQLHGAPSAAPVGE